MIMSKYITLYCDQCGAVQNTCYKCPICGKYCKKIKLPEIEEDPKTVVIDEKNYKKVDMGELILTRNDEENNLYNIEFSNSDLFGVYDLTWDEIINLKKQIVKEKKRRLK